MFLICCSGADDRGNTVVDVEPALTVPIQAVEKKEMPDEETIQAEEEARLKKEAEDQQRADEEAAEAAEQKQRDDEAKKSADEEAAREAAAEETLKPVVLEPENAGLPLTFRDASGEKTYTVSFKTKPLGMDFNQNVTPVKVTKAFGAARELGVSEGSELIDIAGRDVAELGFEQMLVVLKERIAPLSAAGLEITFRDGSGGQRPVVFPTRPLGMEFNDGKKPITIKKVSPEAEALGVEVNWELMSIAGTDTGEMDFDKMLELLRSKIETLPSRD